MFSYVQLLERQHAQLTAGLHELYRRIRNGGAWTGPQLEADHHQPLTHKILEGLGVLQIDGWEGTESGHGTWHDFEAQGQNHSGWMYSGTASPSTQAAFSPTSPAQTGFSQSIIMAKRQSKVSDNLPPMTESSTIPPLCMPTLTPVKLENHYRTYPNQTPAYLDSLSSNESINTGLDRGGGPMVDWSYGIVDWYGNPDGQEQPGSLC